MPLECNSVQPETPAPLREYAQAAVAAHRDDPRRGVLTWRIANYLCLQTRAVMGRPTAELAQVGSAEREHYLWLATSIIALADSIEADAPPTVAELARHAQRTALSVARARARTEAHRRGHQLDVYRPSDPGYELAQCRLCGSGVTIHLETAGISTSHQLELPCESTPR